MEFGEKYHNDLWLRFVEHSKSCLCFVCDKIFEDRLQLRAHIFEHIPKISKNKAVFSSSTQNLNTLNECDDPLSLVEQSQTETRYETKKGIYVCVECSKEFKRKDSLEKHLPTHSGLKSFVCIICNKKYSRKDRLFEHYTIHFSNGWTCYFCGKMFSQRCILKKHEITHRGVKPFSCELCDRRFSRKNDMQRHRNSHTGENLYFCEICDKGFFQKRLLNRHSLLHLKSV